jgi:hypothetical protein
MSMKPKHFRRGDPFSARHMNDIIGEARGARSVRASNDGFVNDPQGNRVFNTVPPGVRLAVAIEDFQVQDYPTDFAGKIDKAPSGKCLMLRLNNEADYIEETRNLPFRAYDPIAYRNETESKSAGSSFHVVWNSDTKRWECIGSASGGGHTMWFVIVDVLCPDGYEVEQTTLRVTPLWYTGNCGSVPPGRQEDGYWHVYDICSYLNGQVAEDLPSTIGRATYYSPYTADDYDPPPCDPAWILSDLCAQPEC